MVHRIQDYMQYSHSTRPQNHFPLNFPFYSQAELILSASVFLFNILYAHSYVRVVIGLQAFSWCLH